MRIVFDQGSPEPLRAHLTPHTVSTAFEMGWANLSNGDLLKEAEKSFDVLVTTDQSMRYQQNLAGRRLAIVVLMTTSWPLMRQHVAMIAQAIDALQPGEYREIRFTP